jgi:NADH-quinone oxidoreductase subunit M
VFTLVDTQLLTALVVVPLLGALCVLCMPAKTMSGLIKSFTLVVAVLEFVLSLRLLGGQYASGAMQFAETHPWVTSLGISYKVGVDGISLWLLLLTTFVTPIALYASWPSIQTRVKEYALAFLVLESSMIGAFVALDVFLFYVFWELMLVPMALIVGVWGGKRRVYAAVKFFLYTLVGSLLMLVAILVLVWQYREQAGTVTFDLEELNRLLLPHQTQMWLFLAFALAFAIKVPMFPFHTWLPDAHVEAPTGGSVILAAVLLKLGGYGFIRFAMPLFPYASHQAAPTLALLAVIGILYGAWCAWVQDDVKKLVAYSSVSHLGFVMLGILSMNPGGIQGSILQMVNHGISTGALFLLVGVIYERRHTRSLQAFGGLAATMPMYTLVFVVVTMSSIGLPATNGFVGEFMILAGTFMSERLSYPRLSALVAASGVIFSAVYMLHAVLKMFWGTSRDPENEHLTDLNRREKVSLGLLLVFVFWPGLYPRTFLEPMTGAVDRFATVYNAKLLQSYRADERRLLPKPNEVAAATARSVGGGSVSVASVGGDTGQTARRSGPSLTYVAQTSR